MNIKFNQLLLVTFAATLLVNGRAQQQETPLGTRYSAATDVSHISFQSPLVSYGGALSDIQLPAAPIQPANLKQAPPEANQANLENIRDEPQSQQYISVQQYPANPQLQAQLPKVSELFQPQLQQQQQVNFPLQPQQPFQNIQLQQPQFAQSIPQLHRQLFSPQFQQLNSNGYFATGPFAAQYPVVNQFPGSLPSAAPLVSRVTFNRPTAGFSYSF
ncbi:hypothetical protein ABEB36_009973 [Hypothenemus hampei]|uniref:Uncharacterized protein n=1 Tax=Hypothenemus hampei TaxID=57062 RepID=A0ABD1EIR1_HYPHA